MLFLDVFKVLDEVLFLLNESRLLIAGMLLQLLRLCLQMLGVHQLVMLEQLLDILSLFILFFLLLLFLFLSVSPAASAAASPFFFWLLFFVLGLSATLVDA